jgi:hypothetical protein
MRVVRIVTKSTAELFDYLDECIVCYEGVFPNGFEYLLFLYEAACVVEQHNQNIERPGRKKELFTVAGSSKVLRINRYVFEMEGFLSLRHTVRSACEAENRFRN